MAREAQALTIAARLPKPQTFNGTPTAWRVLCDLYPSAETVEVIGAVLDYCAVRRLDPFKRPVHIVPMYNSKLRRKVQVVMQGINEIEITASRTGKWAGMDPPKWGPEVERTFRGSFERDDGSTVNTEVTLRYPEWCAVTVYRLRGDQRDAYTEQLWWDDCYARASFRSEVPNARWQQARHQMLHKCAKAAVLRAAFPEEGFDATAEEMEGRETEGGYTIDAIAEPAATGGAAPAGSGANGVAASAASNGRVIETTPPAGREAERERQSEVYADPPPPSIADQIEAVRADPARWMKLVEHLCDTAPSLDVLLEIGVAVQPALETAPSLIRDNINEWLRRNHDRLAPPDEPPDPIADLLAEVAAMGLPMLDGLRDNASWRSLTADLFPTDADRLDEALAERKRTLTQEAPTRDDNSPLPPNPGP